MSLDQLLEQLNSLNISGLSSQLDKCEENEVVFYNLKNNDKALIAFEERLKQSKSKKIVVNNIFNGSDPRVITFKNEEFQSYLFSLLDHYYPVPQKKYIGITGTNGKTSCVHHLAQLLAYNNKNVLTIGTLGIFLNFKQAEDFSLTTPGLCELRKTLFKHQLSYDYCLMEVSSHSLDQDRIHGVTFEVVGWTNLTQDHLDYHQTMDKYFEAKLKIKNYLKDSGKLFISEKNVFDKIKNSENIELAKNFDLSKVSKNLQTTFALKNINLCLSILENLGLKIDSLDKLTAPSGRFESVELDGKVAIVDYAHTPDALENVCLGVRQSYKDSKLITVFGCGGDRDSSKRPIMGQIAQQHSDHIVVTSDNPRSEEPQNIINDILKGVDVSKSVSIEADRKKAIHLALSLANSGDIVLVAGKGHETYQEVKGLKTPFDDLKIIKNFWGLSS